jgi:hypothetical protein
VLRFRAGVLGPVNVSAPENVLTPDQLLVPLEVLALAPVKVSTSPEKWTAGGANRADQRHLSDNPT